MSRQRSPGTPPLESASMSRAASAASSASAVAGPSTLSKTSASQKVDELVNRVRRNPRDAAAFEALIPEALDHVHKGKGKLSHPFCARGGNPELELQTCMLRALSKAGKQVDEWLQMLGKNLYQCIDCYKRYLVAKDELRYSYLVGFTEAQIERFLSHIDDWEEELALELFRSRNVGDGAGLGFLAPSELYAILSISALRDKICSQVIAKVTPHRLSVTLKETPPGLLRLTVDSNPEARQWARTQLWEQPPIAPMTEEICRTRPVQSALTRLAEEIGKSSVDPARQKQLWEGVRLIHQVAPAALGPLGSKLFGLLNTAQDENLPSMLLALDGVLRSRGTEAWSGVAEKDNQEFPKVLVASIFDNSAYIRALSSATAEDIAPYTIWMRSLLWALAQPTGDEANQPAPSTAAPSSGTSTPRQQDTPPPSSTVANTHHNMHSDILKQVVHFLLERLQQSNHPSRSLLLQEGISIIIDTFETISDLSSPVFESVSAVVGLYARTISALAFRGTCPSSSDRIAWNRPLRQKARDLVLQMFEADQAVVSDAVAHLSELSQTNLFKWRQRRKPGHPNAEEIYAQAAREVYPSPKICTELWSNSYQCFNASAASTEEIAGSAALFLRPLAKLSLLNEPTLNSHLLSAPSRGEQSKAYNEYKQLVKNTIISVSRRMRAMRGELPMLITEMAEAEMNSSHQADLQDQAVRLAEELMIFNLSPVPEVHRAAQNLVRVAFEDVDSRADIFRALLSRSTASLTGLQAGLDLFVQACNNLVEANDAAKWLVRSGADILEVLCGRTGGLLRPGAEHSLVDRGKDVKQALERLLPDIWRLMSRSVAVIFQKTPKWSEHIAKEDMVAWFRDVTLFASQLTEEMETIQKACNCKRSSERKHGHPPSDEEEDTKDFIVSCLALPLEQAISWLRINDLEIVAETLSYVKKTLDCFKGDYILPTKVADKMLKFIREQIEVQDANERKTLLSVNELMDLQAQLDPSTQVVEISDSEDESIKSSKKTSTDSNGDISLSSAHNWLASLGSPGKKSFEESAARKEKKKKLKQQKLSFAKSKDVIDVDALDSNSGSGGMQKWIPDPPRPTSATPAPSSANKYKSATSSTVAAASARSVPARPQNANMAALRKDFAAQQRSFAPNNVNRRPPVKGPMTEPRAPAASSSVTGAAGGQVSHRASKKDSDDSESSSSDEETGPKGLAALTGPKKSPEKVKGRAALQPAPQAQARRTKLLDEDALEKSRRERAEAERKRLLRAPTDLIPLHSSILGWDWYHTGDSPPPARGSSGQNYATLPRTFANASDYVSAFGPLLILECWAQFLQAKEEYERGAIPMYSCTIGGRVSVDAFVDVSATFLANVPKSFRLGESDIVVMRHRQEGSTHGKERLLIAKVEAFKMHPQGSTMTLRCVLDNDQQGLAPHLVQKSIWDIGSLFTLSTVNREFAALLTAQHFDLAQDILKAKVAARYRPSSRDLQMMKQTYGVNDPQGEAILGALNSNGFSLIQGPPGTGKTKTICSLVAHFVATRKSPSNVGVGDRKTPQAIPKKLLTCAPSNAAIDEVARRAKMGMRGPDGKDVKISVVRIGREEAMNVAVKDISLDHLIEEAMARSSGKLNDGTNLEQLLVEIRAVRDERDRKQMDLDEARKSSNTARIQHLEVEIRSLTAKRMTISQKLDEARDKRQTATRQIDADRRKIRQEILLNADIICSTLSGAGHEALASLPIDFETVIIDEAAQAIELSTLIPLRYSCKRCILVGDPKQLPPTVISSKADRLGYSNSLFNRMYEQAQDRVYLLNIQYRMHPEISLHPSETFYGGNLRDGPDMAGLRQQGWHSDPLLRPFQFCSVQGLEKSSRGHSYMNTEEATTALAIYERLRKASPSLDFDGRVGCVTMYKGQVIELKRVFANRYGPDIDQRIDFNTVDGFQGQEKDIIILSCVRTGKNGLGFLTDGRRINVAITRAKCNLFIVGNADGLKDASKPDGLWRALVDQAQRRGALQKVNAASYRAPIGASVTSAERKGGRARPAGWVAAEQQSQTAGNTASAASTVKRVGGPATPDGPSNKRLRTSEPAGRTPIGPSSANGSSAPARPPPAGLTTMRPGDVKRPPPSGPSGLQTRRPDPRPSSNGTARPPQSHGEANGNTSGPAQTKVVRVGNGSSAGSTTVLQRGSGVPARPPDGAPRGPAAGQNRSGSARPPGAPPRPPAGVQESRRPPPPPGPNSAGPSQAALDAMFVKKRKK